MKVRFYVHIELDVLTKAEAQGWAESYRNEFSSDGSASIVGYILDDRGFVTGQPLIRTGNFAKGPNSEI